MIFNYDELEIIIRIDIIIDCSRIASLSTSKKWMKFSLKADNKYQQMNASQQNFN